MQKNRLNLTVESETRLTQHIYRCVDATTLWQPFMQELVDVLDARSSRMLVMNGSADTVQEKFFINHDDYYQKQYVGYYVNKCPWRLELAYKPKGIVYSTYLDFSCKQKAFRNTEFYNDWARPQNIEHGICGTIFHEPDQTVQLLVQRTKEVGHFDRNAVAFANRLAAHVRNAITLSKNINKMLAVQSGIKKIVNCYTLPFALIDEQFRISFISKDMEKNIQSCNSLSLANDRLVAFNPNKNAKLQRLIKQCHLTTKGKSNSAGGIVTIPSENKNLKLRVMPLTIESDNALFSSNKVFSIVFLDSIDFKLTLNTEQLFEQYNLTQRECRLAALLCEGLSLDQIAKLHNVETSTLRAQLKSVYLKTNTHRQGELIVTLLNSFAARRN